MSGSTSRPRWLFLLRPRWLAWHLFAVVAVAGMLWLGDWQLHRAESGNELSWAYTFEWPIFAVCGVYFWARTIREELHGGAEPGRRRPPGGEQSQDNERAQLDGAEPEGADAYLARLTAEVRGHGKWHGLR
jgi:hypothetical protein